MFKPIIVFSSLISAVAPVQKQGVESQKIYINPPRVESVLHKIDSTTTRPVITTDELIKDEIERTIYKTVIEQLKD